MVGFESDLTFIATAAHVVEGDPRPRINCAAAPHLTYVAMPVRVEAASDVAVLKVIGILPGTVALLLDERPVEPADALQAIGFPRRALQPHWKTAGASSPDGSRIVLDEGLAEGHSGGPLLREGWVVGMVNATESDFSYATSAPVLRQILASWKVPVYAQTTRKSVPEARAQEPEDVGSRPAPSSAWKPQAPPNGTRCTGAVASSTGSGQPVRIAASPGARVMLSLAAGTSVAVQGSTASAGYRWYRVVFNTTNGNQQGWMQADHLSLTEDCKSTPHPSN